MPDRSSPAPASTFVNSGLASRASVPAAGLRYQPYGRLNAATEPGFPQRSSGMRQARSPRSSAPSDVASFPPIGNVLSLLDLVPSGSSNPPYLDPPGVSRN